VNVAGSASALDTDLPTAMSAPTIKPIGAPTIAPAIATTGTTAVSACPTTGIRTSKLPATSPAARNPRMTPLPAPAASPKDQALNALDYRFGDVF
jgi:hypothetical protein